MTPVVSNSSNEPALYAVALVFIDARLTVLTTNYERLWHIRLNGSRVMPLRLRFLPNQSMPIFKDSQR